MTVAIITRGLVAPVGGSVVVGTIDCPEIAIAFDDELEITVEIEGDVVC